MFKQQKIVITGGSSGLGEALAVRLAGEGAHLALIARNPQKLEIAQSVGALIAVLHQRQLEERAKVADSFAAFDGEDTRAGFRKLFKGAEVPA